MKTKKRAIIEIAVGMNAYFFFLRVHIDLRERKKEHVDKFNLSKLCQRVNYPFCVLALIGNAENAKIVIFSLFLFGCLNNCCTFAKVMTVTVMTNTISSYEILR